MPDYLVQEEDGTSRFTLEEGGGFLLLENEIVVPFIAAATAVYSPTVADNSFARVSQFAVEVIVQPDSDARVSQLPIEVIRRISHETVTVVIWD